MARVPKVATGHMTEKILLDHIGWMEERENLMVKRERRVYTVLVGSVDGQKYVERRTTRC